MASSRSPDRSLVEPSFFRPDVFHDDHAREDVHDRDDVWVLRGRETADRHFVRGMLPVVLTSSSAYFHWGIWVELDEQLGRRPIELWKGANRGAFEVVPAVIANQVAGYPQTIGLPVSLRLDASPSMRPRMLFRGEFDHPFVRDCIEGIGLPEARRWLTGQPARTGNRRKTTSEWWWLSFIDPDRPEGERFAGVSIVRAGSGDAALRLSHHFRINPGGEVKGNPLPPVLDACIDGFEYRLLTRDDCAALDARFEAASRSLPR
jgi:hypothetical protein